MDAKLTVIDGPWTGRTIPVTRGTLLIGRAEDCNVRTSCEIVSAYHCVLLQDGYTLRIRDLASKNGTHVNGRRIGTGSTILLHNDVVVIGDVTLLVDLTQPTARTEPGDSSSQPLVSPLLERTGVVDGETLQVPSAGPDSSASANPLSTATNPPAYRTPSGEKS